MPRIAEREEQRYGHCTCAALPNLLSDSPGVLGRQWDDDAALAIQALADSDSQLRWHKLRRAVDAKVVQRRAVLPADLKHVLEALGNQEGRACALVFKQSVGGHGGAVGDVGVSRHLKLLHAREKSQCRVVRRRREFEHPDLAPVDQSKVGESTPNIHTEDSIDHITANLWQCAQYVKARPDLPRAAGTQSTLPRPPAHRQLRCLSEAPLQVWPRPV